MFAEMDSLMFSLCSTVFFIGMILLAICLTLVVIFAICIFIKRLIFSIEDESQIENKDEKNKDAVVGFALKNNNIRRE